MLPPIDEDRPSGTFWGRRKEGYETIRCNPGSQLLPWRNV